MVFSTEKKVPARVFFALVALLGLEACQKVGLRNGDAGTIVNSTTCWKDPGGEDASRLEAPTGQENYGLISEGARVIVTADEETAMFGATSGMGSFVRVKVNGENITPTMGIIDFMAREQGISSSPSTEPQNQICWIDSRAFAPDKK